jgi:pSer/pThr/pTyr-binding forkhead associated (FHA) protein
MTVHLPRFCVRIELGDGPRREVVSGGDRVVVGRSPEADLVVDDHSVSPLHCEIVRETDGFVLRDLGSERGTWLAGVRVREVVLPYGSRFELGSSRMFFGHVSEAEAPIANVETHAGETPLTVEPPSGRNLRLLPRVVPLETTPGGDDGRVPETPRVPVAIDVPFKLAKSKIVSAFELEYLTAMLARHRGNITASANAAELDRVHFLRLLDRYGLRKTKRTSRS